MGLFWQKKWEAHLSRKSEVGWTKPLYRTGGGGDLHAEGLGDDEDVGEDDGGVQGEPEQGCGQAGTQGVEAASHRRMGWSVSSQASSGVWQMVKKSLTTRISRNSGRYRPAWTYRLPTNQQTNKQINKQTYKQTAN